MTPVLKTGSDESHFNAWLIVSVHIPQSLKGKKSRTELNQCLQRETVTRRAALSTAAICNSIRKEVSEQSPARHQALCYSLFLQKQAENISPLRIFQLINIFLAYIVCMFV